MKHSYIAIAASAIIASTISACVSIPTEGDSEKVIAQTIEFKGNPNNKKSIFVFLDGTANDSKSGTNVWRLYQLIRDIGDKQITAKYIEGVGSTENPEFNSSSSLGLIFGQGMEARIKSGYDFIAKNYKQGDDIYIFGFSRGAHEARSLAGFISYVGIPEMTEKSTSFGPKEWNKILEITKRKNDIDYVPYWKSWKPENIPPLAKEAKDELGLVFNPVQITMLGVWDTVPGSSFKKFGICKELPDGKDGDRYKSDSYPSVRRIAHAVSIDEKRNKFKPLLLCPALYPDDESQRPQLFEKWFPGAHADVGGGYSDGENSLPNISLNWMIDILGRNYKSPSALSKFAENPNGLAHWSIGDMYHIPGMQCEDRNPPVGDARHPSANMRSGNPPIRVKESVKNFPYPISCADESRLISAP